MIPLLGEEHAAGQGRMARKIVIRAKTDPGEVGLDAEIEFHHALLEEDLLRVEHYIPGVRDSWGRAFGARSDGRRPLQWVPAAGECRITLTAMSGVELYAGPAIIRRANVKLAPKASLLVVSVRLAAVDPDRLKDLGESIGVLVDYEIAMDSVSGAAPGARTDGGLPFGKPTDREPVECGVDDIVTLTDGGAYVVTAVLGDHVTLRPTIVDAPEVAPVVVPVDTIAQAIRVAGPAGGPPDRALSKLARAAPNCRPEDLLIAVLQAQESGQSVLTDRGWSLTSTVLATAAALSDPTAPPVEDTEEDPIDESDLPPDADVDRGELLDAV